MTALNTADNIMLGLNAADRVYAGANLVWERFKPTALSGCIVWLDASKISAANGAAVTWTNLAGASPTLLGSPNPTFRTNVLNTIMPCVRITQGQGRYRWTGLNFDKEYTLFIVARRWQAGPGRILAALDTAANILYGWHGNEFDCAYAEGWFNTPGPVGGVPSTLAWKLYSGDSSAASTARLFSNGVLLGQHPAPPAAKGFGGTLCISGYTNAVDVAVSQQTNCDVAELIVYDRKLSDADRQKVERYLEIKWRPSGFKPTDLGADLWSWFDASDAATVTLAGGVSQWASKGGAGALTLTQPIAAYRPSYASNKLTFAPANVLKGQNSPTAYDFIAVGKPHPASIGGWRCLLHGVNGFNTVIIETGTINLGTYQGAFFQAGAPRVVSPINMTSNSAPAPFAAVASSEFSGGGFEAFRAFDGDPATCWHTAQPLTTEGTSTIRLDFGVPTFVAWYVYQARNIVYHCWKDWVLYGTNDLVNWTAISTVVNEPNFAASEERAYVCDKPGSYRWIQWNVTRTGGSQGVYCEAGGLRVYSAQIVSPTNMTSDTAPAPYSVFESSTWPDPTTEAFRSFDGIPSTNSHGGALATSGPHTIQIDLGSPSYVSLYCVQGRTPTFAQAWKDWTFQGSNDGTNWTTLHTVVGAAPMTKPSEWRTHYCTAPGVYRWYKWVITASQATHTEQAALQLYGGTAWGNVDGLLYGQVGPTKEVALARDGGALLSTGIVQTADHTVINFFGGFSVDLAQSSISQGFGEIREFILIPHNSPTSMRQKLEGYAAHKWGLSALLPADHPYKNAPPL